MWGNWNAAGPSSGSNWQRPGHGLSDLQQAQVMHYYQLGITDPEQLVHYVVGPTAPDQIHAFLAEQQQQAAQFAPIASSSSSPWGRNAEPLPISNYSTLTGALGEPDTSAQTAHAGSAPDPRNAFLSEQKEAGTTLQVQSTLPWKVMALFSGEALP
jgi:hypothetical protein